jgi:DNA-binding response OmpR family regulator
MKDNISEGDSRENQKSVLIVDDDEQLLFVVKVRLEKSYYKTYLAHNSEEAFHILKNSPIDIIILDIILPGKNGYEICYELKKSDEYSDIPVIMLSQKDKPKDRYDAARIGADGYISKPFEGTELIYKIEAVLKEFSQDMEFDTQGMFIPLEEGSQVLVVDDSPPMRKIVHNFLRQLGILNVAEAENGKKAFEILEKEKIRLILSDWNMPEMDGMTLLKKVKSDTRYSAIPFVMVSTEIGENEMQTAMSEGAAGYIGKPFSKFELKKILKKLINKGALYAQEG